MILLALGAFAYALPTKDKLPVPQPLTKNRATTLATSAAPPHSKFGNIARWVLEQRDTQPKSDNKKDPSKDPHPKDPVMRKGPPKKAGT